MPALFEGRVYGSVHVPYIKPNLIPGDHVSRIATWYHVIILRNMNVRTDLDRIEYEEAQGKI